MDKTTGFKFTNTPLLACEVGEYVAKRLKETSSNTISIRIPSMTPVMLRSLQKRYKVSPQPSGYVKFELTL